MMRSREYWKRRAIAFEYYAQQDATKTLDKINRLFGTALENIDAEIKSIRQELGKQTGIVSENELNELLNTAKRDKSYRELQELLALAETEEERIDIMNRINAQAYGARITRADSIGNKILAEFTKAAVQGKILCKELFSSTYADAFYGNIYNLAEGYNAGVDFDILPRRAINKALSEPWNGDNYSGRIWKRSREFSEHVEETVTKGLMTGRSRAKLASELMEYTEHTRYVAERLVRTETSHFLGEGQKEAYKAAGIEKYRYLAALSERTCDICAALDNKVFPLDEATESVNYPPMHPNCRCITITADAELKERLARDPETGKNYRVDGNMNFQQWKDNLSDEQNQAFDLHVRQNRNKSSDKMQYERYKKRLGVENLPKSFDKFQELKYTDVEKWNFIKLDYRRQNELYKHPELTLPNAANATADDRKFTGYLFNPSNSVGYAKGQAFTSRLGYDINNYEELKQEIMLRAAKYPATFKASDQYGDSYEQKMVLYGNKNTPANVIVGWKVKDDSAWLTSTYIKELK